MGSCNKRYSRVSPSLFIGHFFFHKRQQCNDNNERFFVTVLNVSSLA